MCSCQGKSKEFVVTKADGTSYTVKGEQKARAEARINKGTYAPA